MEGNDKYTDWGKHFEWVDDSSDSDEGAVAISSHHDIGHYVDLTISSGGQTACHFLKASTARALGKFLIKAADEMEGEE